MDLGTNVVTYRARPTGLLCKPTMRALFCLFVCLFTSYLQGELCHAVDLWEHVYSGEKINKSTIRVTAYDHNRVIIDDGYLLFGGICPRRLGMTTCSAAQ